MKRTFHRVIPGTAGIFLTGAAALLGLSALAWGLWGNGDGVRPAGLMSIDSRSATATAPAPPSAQAVGRPVAEVQPVAKQVVHEVVAEAEAVAAVPEVVEKDVLARSSTAPAFDGRRLRRVREVAMKVTAYSPDERSCGKWADGWTASGYSVWTNGMRMVAADTSMFPFGTILTIPGYNNGEPVQVLDIGGAIKGHRLDVLYPSHERARQWGVQNLKVTVWEYAD